MFRNEPNHAVASYFQIMKLRLHAIAASSKESASARAKEILQDIKSLSCSDAIHAYWDETNALKAQLS